MMTTSNRTMLKQFVSSAVLASALFFATSAQAQISQQTGVADPGRIERNLTEDRLLPQVGPDITVNKLSLQNAPDGAENIKFMFGGLKLEGASTYTKDELYPIYGDMVGTEVSLADIYAVANQMTLKYRNDGYILTQVVVPPQTIEDGIARLQIVEGYIDNVIIQGGNENPYALKTIQAYAARISKGGALNISDMERQLLLVNDLPGMNARSIISPSATTPGAADMTIILDRDPFEASLGANNYGSRFLGPYQYSAAATLNSVLGLNEAITTQLVAAPDAGLELAYGSMTYEQPVGPWGTKLSVTGSMTNTDPGYTLNQFDVKGFSRSITLQAKHPIIRSRNTNLFGRLLFDWRNVESKNNILATTKDRIRAVRAGLQYEFLENMFGVAVNTFDIQISQGLNIMGGSEEGDANLSRASGDPTFTKANLKIQRLQRVTSHVNILLQGQAQLSNKPLLSSEEFGLGGINTIRGYDPSEVVGDDGIAGKVEIQVKTPIKEAQVFGFLDSGTVWNQDATTSAEKRNSLTSTGGGVRLDLPMDIDAEFTAAMPLHRDVATKHDRDMQFFFSVSKKF